MSRQHDHPDTDVALTLALQELQSALGGLAGLVRSAVLDDCLLSVGVVMPASGIWTHDWAVPFAAVSVANTSANPLTVQASPPQGGAPTSGQGLFIVRPSIARTVAAAGHALTVYGAAGSAFDVQVYVRPRPPTSGPC